MLCGNHNYNKQAFDLMVSPIVIEEGAWIGAKAIVAPGVTVKSHSFLSLGSVAVSYLVSHTIYKGNPAEAVKKRNII